MRKSDLAAVSYEARELNQIKDSVLESLVEVLQSTFSAIATADPEMAIQIIDQLEEQKAGIEAVRLEREENRKQYIETAVKHMADSLDLE